MIIEKLLWMLLHQTEVQLILWTCLFPVTWSLVEYIDILRYRLLIPEPKKSNDGFDSVMLGIFLIGYYFILR